MTTDSLSDADDETIEPTAETVGDLEQLERVLNTLLSESIQKVQNGRVYDAENERVRIKWIRITKDVVAEKRKVVTERKLQELDARLDALEATDADADETDATGGDD